MELAVDAARGSQEPAAWAMTQLGKIHFSIGELDEAARWYERALAALPGYVYALEALAHVEGARGDYPAAIELARKAVDSIPLPQFVARCSATCTRSRARTQLAREQYDLMGAIDRLLAEPTACGRDLEIAVFYADHGIRFREALALAEPGAPRAPDDPGGRRARLGALPQRPLRGSAALLEARAAARHRATRRSSSTAA